MVVPACEGRDGAVVAAGACGECFYERGFGDDERSGVLLAVTGGLGGDTRLCEVVQAPCVYFSGGGESEAVELTGGDGCDLTLCPSSRDSDETGRQRSGAVAFHDWPAELGLLAAAPGVDGAVGVEG